MATIDDKLKLFAKIVFENVEKDSELKVTEFTKSQDEYLENEKSKILKESENLVKQSRKKAEDKKSQILSKVNIDRQHELLKKRKQIFDRTVEDIKSMASNYTSCDEYICFLEKCIRSGLSGMDADEAVAYFKDDDIERYKNSLEEFINKYKKPDMRVMIDRAESDIVGGCIIEDALKTMRVDCSMASIIEDNKKTIGKMLIDNLQ